MVFVFWRTICVINFLIDQLSGLRRSLNSNGFTGRIPPSIGNLQNLYWLDLADNRLTGSIPVSSGSTPGLDMLIHTKHLYVYSFHTSYLDRSKNIFSYASAHLCMYYVYFQPFWREHALG